jgi:hypothetical protein
MDEKMDMLLSCLKQACAPSPLEKRGEARTDRIRVLRIMMLVQKGKNKNIYPTLRCFGPMGEQEHLGAPA